jgi:YbbR domain-containing protein
MLRSLLSNISSILIALLFAVVVWIVATNEENPVREGLFPDAIAITFQNRSTDLTLIDPSRLAARVRIRTESALWDTLNNSDFQMVADLGGLGEGEATVLLTAISTDPRVRVLAVDPPSVQVRLEKISSVPMVVRVRVLDEPPLGYEMRTPDVVPPTVTITGPREEIERVNDATVEISVRSAKSAVDRAANVVLHDAQGNQIQNLEIEPSTVQVHVPVEQRIGYKDTAVKALISGNVASGYWVSDISVEPATVTLVGTPDVLNQLGGFVETEALDVSDKKENIIERLRLVLPEGISVLNANDVMVRVAIDPVLGGLTVQRQVLINDSCNLPSQVSPQVVSVILSGPLPILQALRPDDVQIRVAAPRCAAGSYQSELQAVNVPDEVRVESIVPESAEVNVENLNP